MKAFGVLGKTVPFYDKEFYYSSDLFFMNIILYCQTSY